MRRLDILLIGASQAMTDLAQELEQLQGEMLDFYLIVSDYEAAYGKSWRATWNRRLPPNVFPFQHEGLMAKVAVLSEEDFHDLALAYFDRAAADGVASNPRPPGRPGARKDNRRGGKANPFFAWALRAAGASA